MPVCVHARAHMLSYLKKMNTATIPWQHMWQRNHDRWLLLLLIAEHLVLPATRLFDSSFELTATISPSACQRKSALKPSISCGVEGIPMLEKYGWLFFHHPSPRQGASSHTQKDWSFLSALPLLIGVPICRGFQTFNLFNSLILKLKGFGYILTS